MNSTIVANSKFVGNKEIRKDVCKKIKKYFLILSCDPFIDAAFHKTILYSIKSMLSCFSFKMVKTVSRYNVSFEVIHTNIIQT